MIKCSLNLINDLNNDFSQWEAQTFSFRRSIISSTRQSQWPGVVKMEQPLFPKEYLQRFSSNMSIGSSTIGQVTASSNGGDWSHARRPMPGNSPPPLIRIMHFIGGMDRMFTMAFNRQLSNLEPKFKAMQSRVRL
jgi:hypothetical protein